jgi:hypothetical protein
LQKQGRGDFFCIDRHIWGAICDLETLNLAIAYLVMATGTSGGNTRTKWSAEAIHKRSSMPWRDARDAIATLVEHGFVRRDLEAPQSKPRYMLLSFEEYDRARLRKNATAAAERHAVECLSSDAKCGLSAAAARALIGAGYLQKRPEGGHRVRAADAVTPDGDKVWLPNTLISGVSLDGPSPLAQLFMLGDVWTLRLLVDLYYVHYLDSHQGVDRAFIRYTYERKQVGQQGLYCVWAFKLGQGHFVHDKGGPFAVQVRKRKAAKGENGHPAWSSLSTLRQMGLIAFVPHLFTNDNADTKPCHSLGAIWERAEEDEDCVRNAANVAGKSLLQQGQVEQAEMDGFRLIVPVPHYLTPVVYGTLRLTFRPHTSATTRWYRNLKQKAPEWVERYCQIAQTAETARPALREWQAWGT